MTDPFTRLRRWFERHTPGSGKPWISPAHHALVTVFGLMPYPFGPFGIGIFLLTDSPWLWIVASTWTWVWYLDRELDQHGGRIPLRLDPVLDVLVPFVALVSLWWLLL